MSKIYSLIPKNSNTFMICENNITKSTNTVDGDIMSTNITGNIGTILVKKGTVRKQYVYNLDTRVCIKMFSI